MWRGDGIIGSDRFLAHHPTLCLPLDHTTQVSLIEQEVPEVDQDLKDMMEHIGFKDISL